MGGGIGNAVGVATGGLVGAALFGKFNNSAPATTAVAPPATTAAAMSAGAPVDPAVAAARQSMIQANSSTSTLSAAAIRKGQPQLTVVPTAAPGSTTGNTVMLGAP